MVRFLKSLFGSASRTTESFDPVTGMFLLPDIDALRSRIQLRRRAKELGKQNQSTIEDRRKDSIASDIDLNLENILQTGKHRLTENLAAIDRVIVSGVDQSRTAIHDIETCTQKTLENLYADSKTSVGTFWRIKNNHCIADTDFEAFRLKNKLTHLPIYPENPKRLWGILF